MLKKGRHGILWWERVERRGVIAICVLPEKTRGARFMRPALLSLFPHNFLPFLNLIFFETIPKNCIYLKEKERNVDVL